MKMRSISLVFPMYNEEENIQRVMSLSLSTLSSISDDYEIIIVDDASTDKTGFIAERLSKENNVIKIVHHKRNRGLGASLRSGFARANKDLIVYSDADLPFDMNELNKAVQLLEDSHTDVFTAYRINRAVDGIVRTIYSIVYNLLINLLFNLNLRDINFSFKVFKKQVVDALLPELRSEGSFIDAEMLTVCHRKGFKISQFAVKYFPRQKGESTLSRPPVVIKILKEMFIFSLSSSIHSLTKNLFACYRSFNPIQRLHLYFRFKTCPFKIVEQFIPKNGTILDFGCGYGLFSNYLALTSPFRKIIGIDISEEKIKLAKIAAVNSNITYIQSDPSYVPNVDLDAIVITDVLYLLPYKLQEKLILDCVIKLKNSGVLAVKEMKKNSPIKYFWNLFQETLAVKVLKITKGNGFYFREKEDFESLFKEIGLNIRTYDLSRGYFYPHILYVCTK